MESSPFFFDVHIEAGAKIYALTEPSSRHCIQVLRMQVNESIIITNGKGHTFEATIKEANKRATVVEIIKEKHYSKPHPNCSIAIAPIKNASRWEWFLEKATELGVDTIIPIITKRTEKYYCKEERQQNILVPAMLQSKQVRLPKLLSPIALEAFWQQVLPEQRFIAHCNPRTKQPLSHILDRGKDSLILIGPEGDFTNDEIEMAITTQCVPVSLGPNRLRTETAAIASVALLTMLR